MNSTKISKILRSFWNSQSLGNVELFDRPFYPYSWLSLTARMALVLPLLLLTSCATSQRTVVVKETVRVNNVETNQENIVYDENNRPAARISGELLGATDNLTVIQQHDTVYIDNGYPYPRYYAPFYGYQYLPYPHRHGSYHIIPHIRHMHSAHHHIAHHHGGHHRGSDWHRRH